MTLINKRGIFTLSDVKNRLLDNAWSPISYSNDGYGYYGSGNVSDIGSGDIPSSNRIHRLDFLNDTLTLPTRAIGTQGGPSGVSYNSTHGYFAGGVPNFSTATITRFSFTNDLSDAFPRNSLLNSRYGLAGMGNLNYGYYVGGTSGDWPNIYLNTRTERIDYSNDTQTVLARGNIPTGKSSIASVTKTSGGYFSGSPGSIDFLEYFNDTVAPVPRGNLSSSRSGLAGVTKDINFGYFGGGTAVVDRISFQNDTLTASPRGNLTISRSGAGAFGNSSYAYFNGGSVSSVDRIDYNNDTVTASVRCNLPHVRVTSQSGLSNTPSAFAILGNGSASSRIFGSNDNKKFGYFGGGGLAPSNLPISTITRLDYSSDTSLTSPRSALLEERVYHTSVGNSFSGFFMGGVDSGPSPNSAVTSIERLNYYNDTSTTVNQGNLSLFRYYLTSVGNTTYGYAAGGISLSPVNYYSTVERLTYAVDSVSSTPRGLLSLARGYHAATGNNSYGWFGGGLIPTPASVSTVDRIDYATDTATASPRGSLLAAGYGLAASGNTSYGWFIGGTGLGSQINRVDYASDTVTASKRGVMSTPGGRYYFAATGNSNFGYFGGGYTPSVTSTMERISYADDFSTMSFRSSLTGALQGLSAVSASANGLEFFNFSSPGVQTSSTSFGYFGGGISPAASPTSVTTIDRIDYANDTGIAVTRGPLAYSGYSPTSLSDYSNAYFVTDGNNPFQKLNYATDLTTTSLRASLDLGTFGGISAVGNLSFGWFGGGINPAPTGQSRINRLDYSNDTVNAILRGPLSQARYQLRGVCNNSYGWFTGGYLYPSPPTATVSTIDRIDYANDTVTASPRGSLTHGNYSHSTAGNANYGYIAGGVDDTGVYNKILKLDYSNDTTTTNFVSLLNTQRYHFSGTGNSTSGYFAAGYPAITSSIERIDYDNDTATASTRGNLSSTRYYQSSTSALGMGLVPLPTPPSPPAPGPVTSYGYFLGGTSSGSTTGMTLSDRIDYSNDTAVSSTRGLLNTAAYYQRAGLSNLSYGYVGGGIISAAYSTNIIRTDYSNDLAISVSRGGLNLAREGLSATGNVNYGWFTGGHESSGTFSTFIDRVNYASDNTGSVPRGNLTFGRRYLSSMGNFNFGYVTGGLLSTPTSTSVIDRIDYNNDTITAFPRGSLTVSNYRHSATGNASYGWFGLGAASSTFDRLDYSNDTVNTSPRGNAVLYNYDKGATGNSSYGYYTGSGYSYVERLDYANDTQTTSIRGNINRTNRHYMSGVSAAQGGLTPAPVPSPTPVAVTAYGYFNGGTPYYTVSDRIEYSNDLSTAVPRATLSPREGLSATSNSTYGWFGGGLNGVTYYSTVERLEYSSDLTAMSPRGSLVATRGYLASAGNENYGFFAGGYTPAGAHSTVSKVDYANDTAAASPKGPLPASRYGLSAVGNTSYGWFGGGYNPSGALSSVDLIDYSNDTITAKGNLNTANYYQGATGNANYGYFTGGAADSVQIGRIDYANDTATASFRSGMTVSQPFLIRYGHGATGNGNYGWLAGGYWTGGGGYPRASVQRLDYSNDEFGTVFRGDLNYGRLYLAAASAASNGLVPASPAPSPSPSGPAPSYAYFAGNGSIIERIEYANDTNRSLVRGSFTSYRAYIAGTSSASYGYFGGGITPAITSRVERINYANDTQVTAVVGSLFQERRSLASTSNTNYGWFGGGSDAPQTVFYSTVDRIDYATDSSAASPRGPLVIARYLLAASGNSSYGWFIGGASPARSPSTLSLVDRVEYANDTVTASPRTALGTAKSSIIATGNANYGYITGSGTNVDRLDYSNDGLLVSPRTNVTTTLNGGATGNPTNGYFALGNTINRIDYANDTALAVSRGAITYSSANGDGVSAAENM